MSHFQGLDQKLDLNMAMEAVFSGEREFPEYNLEDVVNFITANGQKSDAIDCRITDKVSFDSNNVVLTRK